MASILADNSAPCLLAHCSDDALEVWSVIGQGDARTAAATTYESFIAAGYTDLQAVCLLEALGTISTFVCMSAKQTGLPLDLRADLMCFFVDRAKHGKNRILHHAH